MPSGHNLHMSQQLSCCDICKIMAWQNYYLASKYNMHFCKFWIIHPWTLCDIGPRLRYTTVNFRQNSHNRHKLVSLRGKVHMNITVTKISLQDDKVFYSIHQLYIAMKQLLEYWAVLLSFRYWGIISVLRWHLACIGIPIIKIAHFHICLMAIMVIIALKNNIYVRIETNHHITGHVFSCDQAALWMVFSVCLSVCLSVRHTFLTMFPSLYHHAIFRSYHHGPG